jgi:hypothetical protein
MMTFRKLDLPPVKFIYVVFLMLLTGICSCKHPQTESSFYYWKTVYKLGKAERVEVNNLRSKKLYVRIMDIDWSDHWKQPIPISPIQFKEKLPNAVEIIPVVYLVNNVLKTQDTMQLQQLASKITTYVQAKCEQAGKPGFRELQIDCDWTKTTMNQYFFLLQEIKKELADKKQILSVTLRLHQFKNRSMGIPPADKVMLMCYNMGNLRKYGSQNSILEISEMEKYLNSNQAAYPRQMDIALPLFNWSVVFRNKVYAGISRIKLNVLQNHGRFKLASRDNYMALKDMPELGIKATDLLRHESVSLDELKVASKIAAKHVKNQDSVNIVYYHLDEQLLKKYNRKQLEKITDLYN